MIKYEIDIERTYVVCQECQRFLMIAYMDSDDALAHRSYHVLCNECYDKEWNKRYEEKCNYTNTSTNTNKT